MLKWIFPPNSSASNRGGNMKRNLLDLLIRAGMLAIVAAIVGAPSVQAQTGAPRYEADLTWPKPLPDRWVLGGLGGVCVDAPQNGDVYVSDGEGRDSNLRIAVMDRTGKFLRQWQPEGMTTVHCMSIANDGQVYVCNREGSRIQIYDKMGNFKKNIEVPWTPVTPRKDGKLTQNGGSAVALDFSHDPNQRLIFLINQNNAQVEIIDRQSGKILSSFGRPGSFPGQFNQAHGIAVDSKDNVYIAENRGRRVHKFRVVNP